MSSPTGTIYILLQARPSFYPFVHSQSKTQCKQINSWSTFSPLKKKLSLSITDYQKSRASIDSVAVSLLKGGRDCNFLL